MNLESIKLLKIITYASILTMVLMLNSCFRCEQEHFYENLYLTEEQKNLFPYKKGDTLKFSTDQDTIELYCQPIENKSHTEFTGGTECEMYYDELEKLAMIIGNDSFQFTFNMVAENRENDCNIHIEFDKMTTRFNIDGHCFNSNPENPMIIDSVLINRQYFINVLSQESISFMYNENYGILKFRNHSSIYELIK